MIDDLDYIELPDQRLQERLKRLVEQISAIASASLPKQCGSWREAKAAYRFLG